MNAYIIQSTAFDFPVYISRSSDPTEITTRDLGYAKVWKTEAGAAKWLADRSDYPARVIEIEAKARRSGLLVARATR